jgi:hypothetical protein
MQQRKPAQMQRGFFIKLQRIDAMLLSLERNETSRRFRQHSITPIPRL